MPTSIIVTITAIGVMLGLQLLLSIAVAPPSLMEMIPAGMVVELMLLWGMWVGHRLAWQWGRLLGLLFAVLATLGAVTSCVQTDRVDDPVWLSLLAGSLQLLYAVGFCTIFVALGRPSAKQHFHLRCPSCATFTSAAADFFFNRAKCKNCRQVW